MKLVLLSGGSGRRLWPLSNDIRSKQFLKLLKDETGAYQSMVQRVCSQLKSVNLIDSTYIATGSVQVDIIQSQLDGSIPLIIEPERRDTFPAISLASTFLYSEAKVDMDEVVCVVPVDHYVDERFFESIKELESIIRNTKANFALMGVKPTYPATQYGYIIPDIIPPSSRCSYLNVTKFAEKPSQEKANELINQKAMWNCGVVSFQLGYLITLLENKGLPTQYEELKKQYARLTKISFDYEVLEKTENIVVKPYEGMWTDLGNWDTLTGYLDEELIGIGCIADNSKNTHIINELNLPVVTIGTENMVIAASPDGILVADKAATPEIKAITEKMEQRPMYEEKRWGWYRVLDYAEYEQGKKVLTKRIGVKAGKNLSYQMHHYRSEVWTIILGEGEFVLDDHVQRVSAGDVLQIAVGSKHGIKAITDLEFIEVQTGNPLIEEDIIRIYHVWDDVLNHCLKQDPNSD